MSSDQIVGGGGHPEQAPASTRRRTGLVVGVVGGVVAAVGLPLGGFALYNALSGGGTQPHDVLPASAIAYARVDLDPSAAQKIEGVRLLQKFPAFTEDTGIDDPRDDVRKAIFEAMKADTGCDLDFEDDVDPWLGERVGVAAFAPADGETEPAVAVALQVKDEETAKSGIEDLLACGEQTETETAEPGTAPESIEEAPSNSPEGWAYLDGYLIIAETQKLADGYAEAAATDPLAGNDAFVADMERLGEPGIASFWFDGAGLADAMEADLAGMSGPDLEELERADAAIEQAAVSGAGALRFDESYAEVAMTVGGEIYEGLGDVDPVRVDLPEGTAVAMGGADLGRILAQQWEPMLAMQGGEQARADVEEFEAASGLSLPEDLQTLLGDNFVLSLDAEGLQEFISSFSPTALRVGAQISTDQAAFDEVYGKIQAMAAAEGVPLQLNKVDSDDGVVLSTNPEYADILAGGGELAGSDKYQQAVANAGEAQAVFYQDFDALDPLVKALAGDDNELMENFTPLRALGGSATFEDGYAEMSLRLTVE